MLKDKRIVDLLFVFILFYQVLYSSLWQSIFPSNIWKVIVLVLNFVLILFLLFDAISSNYPGKKITALSILFALMLVYLVKQDTTVVILFGYLALSLSVDLKKLFKLYFLGIGIGVLIVCGLSLIGVLPIIGNSIGMYSFGFDNPNTLGFYLLELFLLYFVLYVKKINIKFTFLFVLLMIFENEILDDKTASVLLVLVVILISLKKIINRLNKSSVFKFLIALFPVFLFGLTIWIAKNYLNYSWMVDLNSLLSTRPYFWNLYYNTQQISLFGFNFLEIGQGTLDNAYLNYLLIHGALCFTVVMFILCVGLYKSAGNEDPFVLMILIILLVFSFVETMPFRPFQSILLPLAFCIIFSESTERVNTNLT